jgi:hypothetical protein
MLRWYQNKSRKRKIIIIILILIIYLVVCSCSLECNLLNETTGQICSGRGNCSVNSTCDCEANFSGEYCEMCADDYYGENCTCITSPPSLLLSPSLPLPPLSPAWNFSMHVQIVRAIQWRVLRTVCRFLLTLMIPPSPLSLLPHHFFLLLYLQIATVLHAIIKVHVQKMVHVCATSILQAISVISVQMAFLVLGALPILPRPLFILPLLLLDTLSPPLRPSPPRPPTPHPPPPELQLLDNQVRINLNI